MCKSMQGKTVFQMAGAADRSSVGWGDIQKGDFIAHLFSRSKVKTGECGSFRTRVDPSLVGPYQVQVGSETSGRPRQLVMASSSSPSLIGTGPFGVQAHGAFRIVGFCVFLL
jgi:hypothetical protein